MTEEKKQGNKWVNPEPGYKLKSDVAALCAAVVAEFEGKSFGEFYVGFCKDMGTRAAQYGERLYISEKQMAILTKLEVNRWPDGVKESPRPKLSESKIQYGQLDADNVPF